MSPGPRPQAPGPRPSAPASPPSDRTTGPPGGLSLWARAPEEIRRWTTWRGAIVLAVARTLTSTIRLIDALALFRGDPRVQTVFTCDDGSAFSGRTGRLLAESGAVLVDGDEARRVPASLVLTASENVDLTGLDAPVVVLPHGIGFQKYVPDSESGRRRLSGVVRDEFADRPNVITVLTHPAQRDQLRKACGQDSVLADRAEVVGDHVHDRVVAGLRRRPLHRERLHAGPGDRLIVLSSTWGGQGLLGSSPLLPHRLLTELPLDRYRVAAALHPNIWTAHGPWGVRQVLEPAIDAGLRLLPPERGWEAAITAADCVIGDHGSVTLYAAGAGTPVLLGAFGEESVPGTAIGALAESAPRLDHALPLRGQIDAAIDGHAPDRHDGATEQAFAYQGAATHRLRALLYRELGLTPPEPPAAGRTPRTRPPFGAPDGSDSGNPGAGGEPPPERERRTPMQGPAEPEPEWREVTAFEVLTRVQDVEHVEGTAAGDTRFITVERFPAAVAGPADPGDGRLRHLAVSEAEPDEALARSASVILRSSRSEHGERPEFFEDAWLAGAGTGEEWAADTLMRHPGALMAVSAAPPLTGAEAGVPTDRHRYTAHLRDGSSVSVRTSAAVPLGIAAAVAYTVVRGAGVGEARVSDGRRTWRAHTSRG
ncbi:hypothetical protein [Nocardiopsis halophila]|uniref:hypothetical protein n=1 Tax=Nocardiopsis halophila TaxID=141692 RepID=UPI00036BC322|nr:hypothetical protein [Nocardiopsis halophila]